MHSIKDATRSLLTKPTVCRILLLCKLGIVVIGTFALLLSPFLSSSPQLFQIIHRVFPVARGIYEDKVGNAWFALSVFVKIRNILSLDRLVQLRFVEAVIVGLPKLLINRHLHIRVCL